LGQTFILKY